MSIKDLEHKLSSASWGKNGILFFDVTISTAASLFAVLFVRLVRDEIYGFKSIAFAWVALSVVFSIIAFLAMGTNKIVLRHSSYKSIGRFVVAVVLKTAMLAACVLLGAFGIENGTFAWSTVVSDMLLTILMLVLFRVVVITIYDSMNSSVERAIGKLNVMVYGTSDACVAMMDRIQTSDHNNFVGFITQDRRLKGQIIRDFPVYYADSAEDIEKLKIVAGLQALLFERGFDVTQDERASDLIAICIAMGVNILVSPKIEDAVEAPVDEKEVIAGAREERGGIGFIADGMSPFGRFIKRAIDLVGSFLLLLIFSPLFLICYIALKLSDGGPAIYKQERIGRLGRPFYIYKFRSMRLDAEAAGPALLQGGESDPRLTKVGRFLRAHHLDELPQLWNVFRGDMAFIGPRPERQFFIDKIIEIDPRYEYLYQIRPGVTSYATLYNGYTDTVEKMVRRLEYDLYYLRHRSLWFDARVLALTFLNIVFGKKF